MKSLGNVLFFEWMKGRHRLEADKINTIFLNHVAETNKISNLVHSQKDSYLV